MVNCNPETVSTDYDTSDRLYFEPLTFEDVLNIVEKERPLGVIVQFGGQTPLKLAVPLERAGVPHPGHLARRDRPGGGPRALRRPPPEARAPAAARTARRAPPTRRRGSRRRSAIPVLVRPSYVLGGRAMEVVYEETRLREWMREAARVSPDHPILDRQVPGGRARDRRRRALRRAGRPGRRRDGAHREGGHPLRRLGVRAAALLDRRRPGGAAPRADAGPRPRARRGGPPQHPVRDQERHDLRARGQPARLAHRAVRLEGDRACRSPSWRRG